jgi:phospholipase C
MDSRRDFLKKAAFLSGGAAIINTLPPVIQKALAIDPAAGSTFYDAEHVVFLMQENRSFDHALGSLQGVRGFNDPRAIKLPNDNKVWLQPGWVLHRITGPTRQMQEMVVNMISGLMLSDPIK